MRAGLVILMLAALATAAPAETLVAARTIRSLSILTPDDLAIVSGTVPGALSAPEEAVGLEARVVLYAGRPIRAGDVGPAALIERNQVVTIEFRRGALAISTEGRAMTRGGVGDAIRVMNLASRSTISAVVGSDGIVRVPGGDPAPTE